MLTRPLGAVALVLVASGAVGQAESLSCIYANYITEYQVPGEVADVDLDGDLAYIIYGENADGYLRIVNVTDLDEIVTIADLELPYTPGGAKLIDGRLYCYGGLIIDVTTPESPFIYGKIDSVCLIPKWSETSRMSQPISLACRYSISVIRRIRSS